MQNVIRSVEQIIPPPQPHMVGNGFRMLNFFPNSRTIDIKRMSPFVLMDYAPELEYKATSKPLGVGAHPHRGFETVSIVYQGSIAHNDSAGNSGVIKDGDVQWMTAAAGILHKEFHEKARSKKGGILHMVQLWVNLPAKFKMSRPKYQPLAHKKLGKYELPNGMGRVEVIAGSYLKVKGPATTFTPIELYNVWVKKEADMLFSFPQDYNTGILVIKGNVKLNGKKASTDQFVLFANNGTDIELNATSDAVLLVLSGEPINEPIVSYGPFVMNTKEEIMQAYEDLNKGKFGTLED